MPLAQVSRSPFLPIALPRRLGFTSSLALAALTAGFTPVFAAAANSAATKADPAVANFHQNVVPILEKYCYDCHGNGIGKGSVAFDEFENDADIVAKKSLWLAALKNVRGGLMPPREEGDENSRPTAKEIETLTNWIKFDAFGTNPAQPDPGRVTARRLNRVEYRNTIRDLMGIDFNSEVEFPPDDSGNGFDNNGDVLTLSPLLLEKYLAAAESIVGQAVPKVARMIRENRAVGRDFRGPGGRSGEQMNARNPITVSRTFKVDKADKYRVSIELEVRGSFDFDTTRCRVVGRINGEERFAENVEWQERKALKYEYDVAWKPGDQVISFEIIPLPAADGTPPLPPDRPSPTNVNVRVASVQVRGPLSPQHWIAPENHARFFPKGPAPEEPAARDAYAKDVLQRFATRAFRRPPDASRLDELVRLARDSYSLPGTTFEEGVGRAMMAVLASPRFLFRLEESDAQHARDAIAPIDEYSLASRLSYFLWSTMPDDQLMDLAQRGDLRRELRNQVNRMLKDERAQAFVRNFTGQWLQARDIESVPINARVVGAGALPRNRDGRQDFDGAFRRMMRSETEMYFDYVLREDRSVLELIDSDYTFLNDKLAAFYGLPEVIGDQLRRVTLPPNSVRGGILTHGTVLAVTSNPTRTSPVKRGLFILENILGTPPPPAPPDVPDLEEAKKEFGGREPKLSEMLAVHRANPLCSSCHERMDPLGLALENFNALGAWRDTEAGQPIEPAGNLVTGEKFADIRELKQVIVRDRKADVYHCLTEKLLTYALGRGLEYYDTHTLDDIAAKLEKADGRMSALLFGVIESVPFQYQRNQVAPVQVSQVSPNSP